MFPRWSIVARRTLPASEPLAVETLSVQVGAVVRSSAGLRSLTCESKSSQRPTGCAVPRAATMINNPSYAKKPELFHAVALQQQKLASLGLGPPPARRKKPASQAQ